MNTKYVIVDKNGEEIDLNLFHPNFNIPVHIQSVRFDVERDMTIVLRYEHER